MAAIHGEAVPDESEAIRRSDAAADLSRRVRLEVERLHAFISAWFRGESVRDSRAFAREFTDRFATSFVNIQPAGCVLTREALAESIERHHGANPRFRIRVSDCRIVWHAFDHRFAQASYLEHQTGARNTTPPANTRISTALFEIPPDTNPPIWLHLHETAVREP